MKLEAKYVRGKPRGMGWMPRERASGVAASMVESYRTVTNCHQLEPTARLKKRCPSAAALLRKAASACGRAERSGRFSPKADALQGAGVAALERCLAPKYGRKTRSL